MCEIDRGAEAPLGNWRDVGESVLLPTGTVTFAAVELGGFFPALAYGALAVAALAAGDVAAAQDASEAARQLSVQRELASVNVNPIAEVAMARGDLMAARRCADDAVSAMAGWHLSTALITRARVAIAQGEPEQAECDALASDRGVIDGSYGKSHPGGAGCVQAEHIQPPVDMRGITRMVAECDGEAVLSVPHRFSTLVSDPWLPPRTCI